MVFNLDSVDPALTTVTDTGLIDGCAVEEQQSGQQNHQYGDGLFTFRDSLNHFIKCQQPNIFLEGHLTTNYRKN